MELTPSQKRKLEKIAKIVQDGDLAIVEFLFEIEQNFEDTIAKIKADLPDLDKILQTIKGKDALPPTKEEVIEWLTPFIPAPLPPEKGDKGDNYVLTENDKKDIAKSVASKIVVPVVEKVIEKTEVIRETPIVTENVVEKAMYETGDVIVDKINALPIELEFQIGKEHVAGLDEIERLARRSRGGVGGVMGIKEVVAGTGISVDNTNLGYPVVSVSASGITDFVRRDGTTALTADWDAGSFEIRAQTFESDVVTGTAPLVVASTTKVTNLNADLVDGAHVGTSGATIPLLNGAHTWSAANVWVAGATAAFQDTVQITDNKQLYIGDGSGQLGHGYFKMDSAVNGYMMLDLSQIELLANAVGFVIQGGGVGVNPAGDVFLGSPSFKIGTDIPGSAAAVGNMLYVGKTVSSGTSSLAGTVLGIDYTDTTNRAGNFNGANQIARYNTTGNLTSSSIPGISAGRNRLVFGSSATGTITLAAGISASITGATSTATLVTDGFEYYGEISSIAEAQFTRGGKIFLKDWAAPTGSGSVGSLYGLRIEAMTRGTRNYEIALEGAGGIWFRVPTTTTLATERMYSSAASTLDTDANTTQQFRIATTTQLTLTAGVLTAKDAFNLAVGTSTGTKIGTATTQKIGFWNTTPVVQPTHIADPSGGVVIDAEARTAIAAINAMLAATGLTAAS